MFIFKRRDLFTMLNELRAGTLSSEKIMEEAAEVVEAAGEPGAEGREHLVKEAADLIFHLLVMLGHARIDFSEVEAELGKRFGVGGHEEKAARQGPKKPND